MMQWDKAIEEGADTTGFFMAKKESAIGQA